MPEHISPDTPLECGSRERLAVLLFLARRPLGALGAEISRGIGLEAAACFRVCKALRADQRLRSEHGSGADLRWFVPLAREDLRPAAVKTAGRKVAHA